MTTIIDGRKISTEILTEIKKEVASLPFQPIFCDVLVGNDPVSLQYVNLKKHKAEELGIKFQEAFFPEDINQNDLINEIEKLNKIQNMCGIIIQLPLPKNFNTQEVLDAVNPKLDVDCLSTTTSNNFYHGDFSLGYPTVLACMRVLESINIDLTDKKIIVLGQGKLVGKPLSALLKFKNLEVVSVDSKTENKEVLIKEADIIISGIGQGKYLKGAMIKTGAIVIDAGTSESESNGIVGDVDLESIDDIASFVSPVPGGVGPVTVAMLLQNVLTVAKNK